MEPQAPTRLFIALYLDENVDSLVARLVRARGFEVIATEEVGCKGAKDLEQLAYAAAGRLCPDHAQPQGFRASGP
jgi:hypothetical protein